MDTPLEIARKLAMQFNAMVLDNPEAKGDLFEQYCLKRFHETIFDCHYYTPRRKDIGSRQVRCLGHPDFQFYHKPSEHKFWVECKFRKHLDDEGKINWSKGEDQLERYRAFQEEHRPEKVFIVIGLGGMPSMPSSMYCIPLDDVAYPGLFPSYVEKWRRKDPSAPFEYKSGTLR